MKSGPSNGKRTGARRGHAQGGGLRQLVAVTVAALLVLLGVCIALETNPARALAAPAGSSAAGAADDDKKPDEKKSDEKKEGEDKDKKDGEKEGDEDAKDGDEGGEKKEDDKKAEEKAKDDKAEPKPVSGRLTEEQLAEMKRILMENAKKREEERKAREAEGGEEQKPKVVPRRDEVMHGEPKESRARIEDPTSQPASQPTTDEAGDAGEAEPKDPQAGEAGTEEGEGAPPTPVRRSRGRFGATRPDTAVNPATGQPITRAPHDPGAEAAPTDAAPRDPGIDRLRRRGGAAEPAEPTEDSAAETQPGADLEMPRVLLPPALPEGKHPWDMPDDFRPYILNWENTTPRDLLDDFSRMTGLTILGIDSAKGQPVSYRALEPMNFWEALGVVNKLIEPNRLILTRQHFELTSGDVRVGIGNERTYTSRAEFEAAGLRDHEYALVFFTPPLNVTPDEVAGFLNFLPDTVRLGMAAKGTLHVSARVDEIRRLFHLIDVKSGLADADPRELRWIELKNADATQIVTLVQQFVEMSGGGGGRPTAPRGTKGGSTGEILPGFDEVTVNADPASNTLLIKALPKKLDEIEAFVRQVDERSVVKEGEPVIIPLQHANADELVNTLTAVLSGSTPSGGATTPAARRARRGAAGQSGGGVSSVQLGAGSELQLIPESNTNSVIVIANEKDLERVRTFVDIFDVPGPKPLFERVELQHAKVDVIQQVLQGLTGARPARRGAPTADQGLMISADAASNVIFLAGNETDVTTAKEIIAQADVPGQAEGTHLVMLKKQTPSAMAKILSDMHADPTGGRRGRGAAAAGAGGPRFIGDDASNLLVVICADGDWESINSLIGQLDVGAQDLQVTRTFKIQRSDIDQVADLLNRMFGGGGPQPARRGRPAPGGSGDLLIIPDTVGKQLFVRADEETLAEIAATIEQLEAAAGTGEMQRRKFDLAYADPQEMLKAITTFYGRGAVPGRRGAAAAAAGDEPKFVLMGRSLVVDALPEDLESIAELVASLDTQNQDGTEIRAFELADADLADVVRNLDQMFKQAGPRGAVGARPGPQFIANTGAKKIIVTAEPADFPRIERAIEHLRGEGSGMTYREFTLKYAAVEEIQPLVQKLLTTKAGESDAGGRGAKSTKVSVEADGRTKTLFVAAPGEVVAYAEELITALDAPQPEDIEEMIVRTVQLQKAEVEQLIESLQKMMTGSAEAPAARASQRTGQRSFQARLSGQLKGNVSMVPAPGARAVILRGIRSDVDQVETLIRTIDDSSLSGKKVARSYANMNVDDVDELADTIMAIVEPGKAGSKKGDEALLDFGPRIGKDVIIKTDYYANSMLVFATPEKQTEIEELIEAIVEPVEEGEGVGTHGGVWQMVEVAKGDPYDIADAVEELIDDLYVGRRKPQLKPVSGSNLISVQCAADEFETVLEMIRQVDQQSRPKSDAFVIRSIDSPVPLDQLLRIVQQQTPHLNVKIEGASGLMGGEETPLIEEITPMVGPKTLGWIEGRLALLAVGAAEPEPAKEADALANSEEADNQAQPPDQLAQPERVPAAASAVPDETDESRPQPAVSITMDPVTKTLRVQGSRKDVEEFNDTIDAIVKELKKLPYRPDVRVFRLKHCDVNEAARILETVLGAESGGAQARAQQLQQQQLQMQRQMLQQQRAAQQQAQQAQARRGMMDMLTGKGEEEKDDGEKTDEEKQREDQAKEFGATRIRVYPDSRTSTLIVRAASEDFPTIIELLAKIDKKVQGLSEFKIFKLTKLKAADVEAAIKAILGLDRQAQRSAMPGRNLPGQAGQPQNQAQVQAQMQLEAQLRAMEGMPGLDTGESVNWATQVSITSDAATNTILASAPPTAMALIENMITDLEAQDIATEQVKTIELKNALVDEVLPTLQEIFASGGRSAGGAGRMRGGAGSAEEAVVTAFNQVVISGEPRTNKLIVRALQEDMARVEELITQMDVDAGDFSPQHYALKSADVVEVAKTLNDLYAKDRNSRTKIVPLAGTNMLMVSAPPTLRAEIEAQIAAMDSHMGEMRKLRTIQLAAANPETLAATLTEIFSKAKGGPEVKITGDSTSKQLFVVANEETYLQIAEMVSEMDIPPSQAGIKVYELRHAYAPDVLTKMRELVADLIKSKSMGAGKGVELDVFAATADPRTNTVVVMGPPATQALVSQVLGEIDREPSEPAQVVTMLFPLKKSLAQDVARQIQQLYAARGPAGGDPPRAEANATTNTVLVRGTRQQIDEIQSMINNLEQQGTEKQTFVYKVEKARAVDLTNVLNQHLAATRRRDAGGQLSVSVVANELTNSLVIAASQSDYDELVPILKELDVPPDEEAGRVARSYKLRYSDPGSVAHIVQNSFQVPGRSRPEDTVLATVDWGTSTVIVTASEENHRKVKALLDEMDKYEAASLQTKVVKLENAEARDVVQSLTAIFVQASRQSRQGEGVTISNPPGTDYIVIKARESEFAEIQRVITELDQPTAGAEQMRVVTLQHLDTEEAKTILQDYLRKPGGQPNQLAGDVRISTSSTTNSIVLAGSAAQLDRLAEVVAQIDVPADDQSGMTPQLIPLQFADASQVAETVSEMFSQQKAGPGRSNLPPPVVIADPGSNSLLVRGRTPDVNVIRGLVNQLDQQERLGQGSVSIVPVAAGVSVEGLAAQIENTINEAEKIKRQNQKGAKPALIKIGTDTRTNALLVAGTPAQVEEVRRIVATLEEMKPTGARKVSIVKPRNMSAADMKKVLDELVREKQSSPSGGGRRR